MYLEPNKIYIKKDLSYDVRLVRVKDHKMTQLIGRDINMIKLF